MRFATWRGMYRRVSLACASLLVLTSAAAAQVSPEHVFRPGTVALTIAAGGAAFSDFQRATERPDSGGGISFERRVSAGTTGAVGVDLQWWAKRTLGLRAHASFMPSRFAVHRDRVGEDWLRTRSLSAQQPEYAPLRVWVADISLLFRPPLTLGRVAPFGILGGGLVSYRPGTRRGLPTEAVPAFRAGARTGAAAVLGMGAFVPLQRGDLLLSFALTDHVTHTPVAEPRGAELRDDPGGSSLLPRAARVRWTSNVRLLVGVTVPLRSR